MPSRCNRVWCLSHMHARILHIDVVLSNFVYLETSLLIINAVNNDLSCHKLMKSLGVGIRGSKCVSQCLLVYGWHKYLVRCSRRVLSSVTLCWHLSTVVLELRNSHVKRDQEFYLPPDGGHIHAITPVEACTWFLAELTLADWCEHLARGYYAMISAPWRELNFGRLGYPSSDYEPSTQTKC